MLIRAKIWNQETFLLEAERKIVAIKTFLTLAISENNKNVPAHDKPSVKILYVECLRVRDFTSGL